MIAARSYRADIDGLRTLAVLPVVFFHAGLGFPGGFVGVDIFFVISGFLITGIVDRDIQDRKFSLVRFYERRIRRLYPALFAMLTVTTGIAAWLMIPQDFADFGGSLAATTVYASNFFFFFQNGYFNEAAHLKPLLHTWSLAVEEQFYIFFPPALWVLARYLPRRAVKAVLAFGAIVSFALCVWATGKNEDFAFFLLPTRAWELALGGLLALGMFPSLEARPRIRQALSWTGLLLIAVPVFTYSQATAFPGLAALWPCLGTFLLLWVGRDGWGLITKALATPPMVAVGKISYSLYLWHWPIIVFGTYGAGPHPSVPVGIMLVVLSLGFAYLSWRFVEQPVRIGDLFGQRITLFLGAFAASAVAMAVGLGIHLTKGLPSRADPALMAMIDPAQYLHDHRYCHDITPVRLREGDICVRGAGGALPSFALVGDSHADALSPGLFAAAAAAGKAGFQLTAPGFVPLIDIETQGRASNAARLIALKRFLETHPEVRTIFITAYWQHYFTGYTYRHQGTVLVDKQSGHGKISDNPKAVMAGLERFAEGFPDRQFIVLDDVPSGNALYLRHYARSVMVPWRAPLRGLPAKEAIAQHASYSEYLEALAAAQTNMAYRPVLDSLCGPVLCPLFDGQGRPVFRDGDHLSATGAEGLAPRLSALFQPAH
ncbi:MAG: acyltransferase family protein [Parvularcula sp.]